MIFKSIKHITKSKYQNELEAYRLLEECNYLADIINTTTNENEFYSSYEKLIRNFEELTSYKGFVSFTNDPSKDLDNIIHNKPYAIERFKKRADVTPIYINNADPYFVDAAEIVASSQKASIGLLQRQLKIGFNRAYEIMCQLEQTGIVGPEKGTYPRDVLINNFMLEKRLCGATITTKNDEYTSSVCRDLIISEENYDNMTGLEFEQFCARILEKNGFSHVDVTQGSGDHGIDILAEKDDITYAIQCKCYSSNIGNAAVQQAHTGKSIYKRDIAVVLTNQHFTDQAKEEAAALGVKLWNRDKLQELINNSQ